MSRHINSEKKQISKYILISGNSERTSWAAKTFLKNPQLVSKNRLNYIYTGYYRDVRITLASSGMGNSSIAIYVHELFKDYDAEIIIRIGTCGNFHKKLNVFDVVVAESSWFNKNVEKNDWKIQIKNFPDKEVFQEILKIAKEKNEIVFPSSVYSTDHFYDSNENIKRELNSNKCEVVDMESATLFSLAKYYKRKAGSILMVSDHVFDQKKEKTTFEDRVTGTKKIYQLGLNSLVSLAKKK